MKRLAVLVVIALAVGSGCAANNPNPVSKAAATALEQPISELRIAANGKSIAAVTEKEHALTEEVDRLIQSGDLSSVRGQKIADAAAKLLNDFTRRNTPTTPPTSETPTESPTETPTTAIPTVTITETPTDTPVTPTDTPTSTGKSKKPKKPKLPL